METPAKKIVVIGAGPGGLTTAMLLASRGFQVVVLEKKAVIGGRNAALRLRDFTFDTGPTFLMLKEILDEIFEAAGRKSEAYLKFMRLEPMYRLQFSNIVLETTTDRDRMRERIEALFPGQGRGLDRYYAAEGRRFRYMYPCLQKDYSSFREFFSREFRRALPHLALGRSLMSVLGDYFGPEQLRLAFTFQAKYLGMSPWECPGAFGILSLIEHAFGIYHVLGGLSEISAAMAKVIAEWGGEIRPAAGVKQLLLAGRDVKGVILENGERLAADAVVINADFAHAMTRLVPEGTLRIYTPESLRRRRYSCSAFMLYLGLDKIYDLPHHNIVFADDYRGYVADIFRRLRLPQDISFYIRNASIHDPALAPPEKSAVYVLVPVPNQSAGIDWEKEQAGFRKLVLAAIAAKTSMRDIEKHIVAEKIITPGNWERDYDIFYGATFNLAHTLRQMLYFRPHNRFEEFRNCYLAGGGTHPGSGLPTIYESGRISANLICRQFGIEYGSRCSPAGR